jgi:hypothetical protein
MVEAKQKEMQRHNFSWIEVQVRRLPLRPSPSPASGVRWWCQCVLCWCRCSF